VIATQEAAGTEVSYQNHFRRRQHSLTLPTRSGKLLPPMAASQRNKSWISSDEQINEPLPSVSP